MGKKLIEVALPLDVINDASAYDKMPGIGAHPKGIHHWWARLPLPTARAILFASIVDDPSSNLDLFPTEIEQEIERERLFEIIRNLCQKKIHLRQEAFDAANKEIFKNCDGKLPTIFDPFAGGGTIPLEAMRLGLPVRASDLNPVAVLINKAQLQLLPEFANQQPVNPEMASRRDFIKWELSKGIASDIRYYGQWVNDEAKKRIGKFFPKAKVGNREYNVVTWLWARTVNCPNPACGCKTPLVRSFILSTKKKPNFYSQPIVDRNPNGKILGYEVLQGIPTVKGTVNRNGATCILCNEAIKFEYVRIEGKSGRIGQVMIGMVIDLGRGKTYISPTKEHEEIALSAQADWKPETMLPDKALGFRVQLYGMDQHWRLFSNRQLLGLSTIHQLVKEASMKIVEDGGAQAYAEAVRIFLTFTIDRIADFNNSLCTWKPSGEQQMHLFTRQAVPMVWDFPEANILEPVAISWINAVNITADAVETVVSHISTPQSVEQSNAATLDFLAPSFLVSTDPPYYDNIGYSDLSDFFYVWLRHGLMDLFPELLSTVLVPKMEELVASDSRYGSKEAAKNHFEGGFKSAFGKFRKGLDPRFPLTVYYAFKQDEEDSGGNDEDLISTGIGLSTGWETLLESLVSTGFQIVATWPIKASQKWRMVAMGTNSLTSYIVLACRPRPEDATSITRREYLQILKRELPTAIEVLQKSNLAPVDLAQATIGPGMGIYSRYEKIMEQDGSIMSVRTALSLINKALSEILAEQEGDFDTETRWALAWFEQAAFSSGDFGDANALALAKNTAVNAMVHAGIVKSGGGKVQLISRSELPINWDPTQDNRIVVWEVTQHLIKQLQEKGEVGAAKLYKQLGSKADIARELAYHLFTICECKGWAQEAQAYNSLVLSWNQIVAESFNIKDNRSIQGTLFD